MRTKKSLPSNENQTFVRLLRSVKLVNCCRGNIDNRSHISDLTFNEQRETFKFKFSLTVFVFLCLILRAPFFFYFLRFRLKIYIFMCVRSICMHIYDVGYIG